MSVDDPVLVDVGYAGRAALGQQPFQRLWDGAADERVSAAVWAASWEAGEPALRQGWHRLNRLDLIVDFIEPKNILFILLFFYFIFILFFFSTRNNYFINQSNLYSCKGWLNMKMPNADNEYWIMYSSELLTLVTGYSFYMDSYSSIKPVWNCYYCQRISLEKANKSK